MVQNLSHSLHERQFQALRQPGESWRSVEESLDGIRKFHMSLPVGHKSLKEVVSCYNELVKTPSGLTAENIPEGLGLTEDVVSAMDSGGLCPRMDKEDQPLLDGKGTLRLTVFKGEGLPIMDSLAGGSCDAYCRITVEDKLKRTRVVRQSLDPIFDETCSFQLRKLSSHVRIEVFDNDTFGSDDLIGWTTLLPVDFAPGETHDLTGSQALKLRPAQRGRSTAGKLHVRLIVFKTDKSEGNERTWGQWYDEVMATLPSREKLHPAVKAHGDSTNMCRQRATTWCSCVHRSFPQLWAAWSSRDTVHESAIDCVHFNSLLEACVLTAMGQEIALTQEEKNELMWEEAKLKSELTVRTIQTRRLTRLLRAIKRGGHKQPDDDHLDRRNLRVLDIGRRLSQKVRAIPPADKYTGASPFMILQARKSAQNAKETLHTLARLPL
eukprot:COSAG02_NODE_4026_length_5886_cov_15.949542_4_plen_437_part_00